MTDRPNTYGRTDEDLAALVAARRRLLGLRQEDLADLAGVSVRFVQFVEGGKASVRLDKVTAVLHVLGLALVVVPAARERS